MRPTKLDGNFPEPSAVHVDSVVNAKHLPKYDDSLQVLEYVEGALQE